ncbi:hypothetical protein [Enterococcus sp. 2201sp1_2201st1_B8_2201SCRN_220225]|uniref:hypothetical protein n=1 Tax=unclassified Enterococcus TaxID=2608891 RepID=UPI0034A0D40A
MLNPYFAYGVPGALLLLYAGFAIFRKRSEIHYIGFVLFIISGFMTAFCFQVLQYAFHEAADKSWTSVTTTLGFPTWTLYIGLVIGILLVGLNLIRAWRRIQDIRHPS